MGAGVRLTDISTISYLCNSLTNYITTRCDWSCNYDQSDFLCWFFSGHKTSAVRLVEETLLLLLLVFSFNVCLIDHCSGVRV